MVGALVWSLLNETCISASQQKSAVDVKLRFHCMTCLYTERVFDLLPKGAIDVSIVQLNLETHHEQMIYWLHSV